MAVVRSPVRSVVRSPVRGVFGGVASLLDDATSYLNGVTPYHYADFISNRMLYAGADVGSVAGGTGYSFTRASQGYYTNADGTLTLFGHNLLLQSQTFDNASWVKANTTITANVATAPDGTITADQMQHSDIAASGISQTLTVSSGATVAASLYVKQSVAGFVRFFVRNTGSTAFFGGWFNTNTGAWGTTAATSATLTSALVETLANGWYRITLVGAIAAETSYVSNWYLTTSDNSTTRSTTPVVFCWGAQLETGSTATTYLPTTSAAASALRRGDRGVLIEGARTNLLLRSQEFDNASWTTAVSGTGVAATVTANAGLAPDGTTTADRIQMSLNGGTTASDISTLSQTYAGYTSGTPYTFTVWLKSNTGVDQTILLVNFNSQSSAVTVTSQWQRFTWLQTPGSTSSSLAGIRLRGSFANGPADLLVWGAQLEAASFPSSYIPTTTASATRAADVLTYTAGVSYPLTLWAEFERAVDTGTLEFLAQIDAGSGADRSAIYIDGSDRFVALTAASSVTQSTPTVTGARAVGVVHKGALRVASNSVQIGCGGTLATEDTSATNPATPTTIRVGAQSSAGLEAFGYTRRLAVINSAQNDAALQAMTT